MLQAIGALTMAMQATNTITKVALQQEKPENVFQKIIGTAAMNASGADSIFTKAIGSILTAAKSEAQKVWASNV